MSFPAFYDLNLLEKAQGKIEKFITCGGINMKSALYIFKVLPLFHHVINIPIYTLKKKDLTPQIITDFSIDDDVETIFTIKNDEQQIIYHNFIIISLKNGGARVLHFENFQVNEENEFKFINEATVFCKRIKLGIENSFRYCNFLLQATKRQVRLLDLNGLL